MKPAALKNTPVFRKKAFRLGIGLLFFIMIMTSIFGKKGLMEIREQYLDLDRLNAQLVHLREQKLRLEAEIKQLENNPKAVEKEARRLGLIKPGEKVIMLPKAPNR